ncbi:MAG: class I SAM-dependent methyltransferase [Alphaproteobacteria bacterium]
MSAATQAQFAVNRRNWDARAALHRADATGSYQVAAFLAGDDRLHAIEDGELGDVHGKRLLHLQCHFGLDTLRLARRGAIVTGLDFSPVAIAAAEALARDVGLHDARFVCANVYDAPRVIAPGFDVVFTTWGTICWLPDIAGWARVVATMLAPGGFLYFADAHPSFMMLEQVGDRLVPTYPPGTPVDRPLTFNAAQTYTGDTMPEDSRQTYEWLHSISGIVGALIDAGLAIEFLHEHTVLPWSAFSLCMPAGDRLWRLPDEMPAIPLALSIRARKP